MPYGTPFEAIICECGLEQLRPSRFCPNCGTTRGLSEFSNRHIRQAISDLDSIKRILKDEEGRDVRLWDYSISHSELQLRFAHHATGIEDDPRYNTVLMCADTKRIVCGTKTWSSKLFVEAFESMYGIRYLLTDTTAGVEIDCGLLVLYELMDAKLHGGLRPTSS